MEDYVTYEQAIKLKELGFDWGTTHYYDIDNKIYEQSIYIGPTTGERVSILDVIDGGFNKTNSSAVDAPTLSQAQKWLRVIKDIEITVRVNSINRDNDGFKLIYAVDVLKINKDEKCLNLLGGSISNTYEQALSAGIDKSLEML